MASLSVTMTDVGQAISSTFVSLLLLVTVELNNGSGSGAWLIWKLYKKKN